MAGQPGLSFAELLRQLRAEARLTQEDLAEAAGVSPGSVSNLERGINRTAHKDTAVQLAGALGLAGPAGELFVAAARGRAQAAEVLAAAEGMRPRLGDVTGSPYRGLKAFEEQDAEFFFGRDAATVEVLDRMSRLVGGAGLLVVSGVSGAGKSSLLRAGVLPRLREAGLPGAPEAAWWPRVVLTPTRAPLDELALRAGVLAGAEAAAVRRELEGAPAWFALTAHQAALAWPPGPAGNADGGRAVERDPPGQRRLLVVVDQFEELFTQCGDEGQRRAFITALHAAATAGHGPKHVPAALVVLGVRADFEARCADYPQLVGPVQDRFLVTAMTERQLRMAITEPAKKAGAKVDDDLADLLLAEVRTGQPGAFGAGTLPLLSHALDQAWRHRTGPAVTLADYDRAGGIDGAVAASAQRVYDRLTPAQQAAARQVFLRLTATSSDGTDTADRGTRAELTEGRSPAEAQDVEAVLEAFAAERLLTLAADTIEISHEVLLTAWPLLRDTWLADTHADRIVRTRLHTTAAEWDRHVRDPSYLYAGTLLQTASDTAAQIGADPARHPPLSQTETDFLHASGHARQRAARRRQAAVAGLLALTLIAITTAVIAVRNAGIAGRNAANATREHALALSRQLAAESLSVDSTAPVVARQLAVAAWRVFPTDQAGSVMATLLADQQQNGMLPAAPQAVVGVAFSRDGTMLASAGLDGTVRLWNPATRRPIGAPLQAGSSVSGGLAGAAFSPGGTLLASVGGGGMVRLWNPATRRPIGAPLQTGSQGNVTGMAFSPDGALLATAGGGGNIRLWNPATRRPDGAPFATTSNQSPINGVAFSPNGTMLASAGGDGTVRLWNPATHRPIGPPLRAGSSGNGGVGGVAFSPDGTMLASADGDGTVRLWSTATRRAIGAPLPAASGQNPVNGVAFSPNSELLASAGADGTVRLWNTDTRRPIGAPVAATSAQGGVYEVAFNRSGTLLASADADGAVRLWNPATSQPIGAPLDASSQNAVSGVAFNPDGTLLASAEYDGTVRLWDPATAQLVRTPLPPASAQGSATEVAFSPGGTLLASVGTDGTLRLWNPATGHPVLARLQADTGGNGGVTRVAFSPDGAMLAAASYDGPVRLWNLRTSRPIGAPLHVGRGGSNGGVTGVAFSRDSTMLAIASYDGTVRLWDPRTSRPIGAPLRVGRGGRSGGVTGVAFSRDGTLLATGDIDGTVRLWNPRTRQPIGAPLRVGRGGLNGGVTAVAFSPDGTLLAGADDDGTVWLWNPATRRRVGVPLPADTGLNGGVLGVAFSPDGKVLATADADGTVRFWELSLFTNPYATLCAYVGPPTHQDWAKYAPGEPQPKICT